MNKFWGNIFKSRQQQADEIDALLVKIPVFQDLNKREIMLIKRILHQREYGKKEIIFQEGEVGLGMYIIVKGGVKILCGPGEQVLAELKDGDFFGEISLLNDLPRSASAVTQSPCTMLCFFKPELLDIINRTPKLGCKILFRLAWTISERLVSTNQQLSELSCSAPEALGK